MPRTSTRRLSALASHVSATETLQKVLTQETMNEVCLHRTPAARSPKTRR